MFAKAVGVVALRHDDYFGMLTQESLHLGGESGISKEEELKFRLALPDERKHL